MLTHAFRLPCWLFLLTLGLLASTSTLAKEPITESLSRGVTFGFNYGEGNVDGSDSDRYNRASGLFFTAGAFIEKPVTKSFRVSAELHASVISELSNNSNALGGLIGFGGKLGQMNKPKSLYIAGLVGYGFVTVSKTGETPDPDEDNSCSPFVPCFNFGPGPLRKGGTGTGFGYRIAVGTTLSDSQRRIELSYINIEGDANGLPDGSTVSMETMSLSLQILY